MNKPVSFELAKLLKEKGYDLECEFFYSKHGGLSSLKPHREYEHLYSYSELLVSYFDGKYDWNSLNVDEGMIALKTAFGESDGYQNCECSAPTISEVVMCLYEKHKLWIYAHKDGGWWFPVIENYYDEDNRGTIIEDLSKMTRTYFDSPKEAYEAGIKHTLNHLL